MTSFPFNLRAIVSVAVACITAMVVFILLNTKPKVEYASVTGRIDYVEKQLGNLPARHPGKYRYLKIDTYPFPFEIFVGKGAGDFKPKSEQLDKLRPGDTITVYYYETNNTIETGLNRFAQYIDKGTVSYFERGDSNKTLGIVVIGLGLLLTAGAVVLWKLKKISF